MYIPFLTVLFQPQDLKPTSMTVYVYTYKDHVVKQKHFSLMETDFFFFVWIVDLVESTVAHQTSPSQGQSLQEQS